MGDPWISVGELTKNSTSSYARALCADADPRRLLHVGGPPSGAPFPVLAPHEGSLTLGHHNRVLTTDSWWRSSDFGTARLCVELTRALGGAGSGWLVPVSRAVTDCIRPVGVEDLQRSRGVPLELAERITSEALSELIETHRSLNREMMNLGIDSRTRWVVILHSMDEFGPSRKRRKSATVIRRFRPQGRLAALGRAMGGHLGSANLADGLENKMIRLLGVGGDEGYDDVPGYVFEARLALAQAIKALETGSSRPTVYEALVDGDSSQLPRSFEAQLRAATKTVGRLPRGRVLSIEINKANLTRAGILDRNAIRRLASVIAEVLLQASP